MLLLKQTLHKISTQILEITSRINDVYGSPGPVPQSYLFRVSLGVMLLNLALLGLTMIYLTLTFTLSLWSLMTWTFLKLAAQFPSIDQWASNVQSTLCQWAEKMGFTTPTQNESPSSQWSGDGDIRPASMSTFSAMPGGPKNNSVQADEDLLERVRRYQ